MLSFANCCDLIGKGEAGEEADGVLLSSDHGHGGLPVRILIGGHCEAGLDPRLVWGADGLTSELEVAAVSPVDDSAVASSSESLSSTDDDMSIVARSLNEEEKEVGTEGKKEDEDISGGWQELVEVSEAGWWQRHVSPGEEYLLFWEEEVLQRLSDSLQAVLTGKVQAKLRSVLGRPICY